MQNLVDQGLQNKEYRAVVHELESFGVMPERAPSLQPMQEALGMLWNLKPGETLASQMDPSRVVVVAGTNGKGSVCATLEQLFRVSGQRVGLYTSPHLQETTERIRIDGQPLSSGEFVALYRAVQSRLKGMRLTHFEMLTLMAAWRFFSSEFGNPVERAIFEVGLGGTWDATNAIPHHHCVITQLGFDHQNLLGHSLEAIASNKFGIIGKKALVVHSKLPEQVLPLAKKIREQTQSTWQEAVSVSEEVVMKGRFPQFFIQTPWGRTQLALPGRRGAENTATALTYFHACGFDPAKYLDSLEQVNWGGRMERWLSDQTPCPVYLSGDHNPQGIASLLQLLPYFPRSHLYILIGIGKDKDRDSMLKPLFDLRNTSIFLTQTPFKPTLISDYGHWKSQASGAESEPLHALKTIFQRAKPEDFILITGSLYLVGWAKTTLEQLSQSGDLCHQAQ